LKHASDWFVSEMDRFSALYSTQHPPTEESIKKLNKNIKEKISSLEDKVNVLLDSIKLSKSKELKEPLSEPLTEPLKDEMKK